MRAYSKKDVDKKALKGAKIAVVGYGSQGRAHALNLKDSGYDVVIGVRKGDSWKQAKKDGLAVAVPADAVKGATLVALLTPDTTQAENYKEILPSLARGATLLIAPKGPGGLVRRQYQEGRGVPCLIAVAQDASGKAHAKALTYADGIGGTRAGVIQTTFKEETETDLFGEQAVLCGGATELVLKGYETLVEAGYQPEVAYYECMHELKLIVDLLHEGGLAKMHKYISHTAKWGDLTRGPRVVNKATKKEMKKILGEIQDGSFARVWIRENKTGRKKYDALMKKDLAHPIEKVGAGLRGRMPWLNQG
jgi:ketol-acid reductoisomerase